MHTVVGISVQPLTYLSWGIVFSVRTWGATSVSGGWFQVRLMPNQSFSKILTVICICMSTCIHRDPHFSVSKKAACVPIESKRSGTCRWLHHHPHLELNICSSGCTDSDCMRCSQLSMAHTCVYMCVCTRVYTRVFTRYVRIGELPDKQTPLSWLMPPRMIRLIWKTVHIWFDYSVPIILIPTEVYVLHTGVWNI